MRLYRVIKNSWTLASPRWALVVADNGNTYDVQSQESWKNTGRSTIWCIMDVHTVHSYWVINFWNGSLLLDNPVFPIFTYGRLTSITTISLYMIPPSSLGNHLLHRTPHHVTQRLDPLRIQKYTRYLYANNKPKTAYQTPRTVTKNILFYCTAHPTNIAKEFNTAHYNYNIYLQPVAQCFDCYQLSLRHVSA